MENSETEEIVGIVSGRWLYVEASIMDDAFLK